MPDQLKSAPATLDVWGEIWICGGRSGCEGEWWMCEREVDVWRKIWIVDVGKMGKVENYIECLIVHVSLVIYIA